MELNLPAFVIFSLRDAETHRHFILRKLHTPDLTERGRKDRQAETEGTGLRRQAGKVAEET